MKHRLIKSGCVESLQTAAPSVNHQEVQTGGLEHEALRFIQPRPYRVCSMVFRRRELNQALREQESFHSGCRPPRGHTSAADVVALLETKPLPRLRQTRGIYLIRSRSKSGLSSVTPATSDHTLVPVQNFSFVSATKKRRKKPFQKQRLVFRQELLNKLRKHS